VSVSGAGFRRKETANVYFDLALVASARANRRGAFTASLMVPDAALPGDHSVLARGARSRLMASATFVVRTDWTQGGFDAGHSCFNQYENVIYPEDVKLLAAAWSTPVGGSGDGSPV